ncbi:hypothetical protein MRX96_039546 [Rhipicephalus microplus]
MPSTGAGALDAYQAGNRTFSPMTNAELRRCVTHDHNYWKKSRNIASQTEEMLDTRALSKDASTVAALMDYVPRLDATTSVLTANCAGHDESCVMMPFLIPSTIMSCHMAHSLAIRSRSSQLFRSGSATALVATCLEIRFASLSSIHWLLER